jgi:hypothetical protein
LVRPIAVDRPFAQLAFAIDHGITIDLVAARAPLRDGKGAVAGACGRRQRGVPEIEQKGNTLVRGAHESGAHDAEHA